MSRRRSSVSLMRAKKPDSRYGSVVVAQLIAMLMKDGKKQKAAGIVYAALNELYAQNKKHKWYDATTADEDASVTNEQEASPVTQTHINVPMGDDMVELRGAIAVFSEVLNLAGPSMELESRRIGGANIQVPVTVRADRRITLALRSLIRNARARVSRAKSMAAALAHEMIGVLKGDAKTLDEKEQMLRMAKANEVFKKEFNKR